MEYTEFKKLVHKMRQAQKDYFRTRLEQALRQSKDLESQVDSELSNQIRLF